MGFFNATCASNICTKLQKWILKTARNECSTVAKLNNIQTLILLSIIFIWFGKNSFFYYTQAARNHGRIHEILIFYLKILMKETKTTENCLSHKNWLMNFYDLI